jgi:UPF0716 protein FxsA
MLLRLLLLCTLIPLVEMTLLLVMADLTGWQWTLALVIFTGVVGAWLARRQGRRCWREAHEALRAGQLPADSMLDGVLILIAGVLLVTPGILTDLTGFALLTPPLRRLVRDRIRRRFEARFHVTPGGQWPPADAGEHDQIIETKIIDVKSREADK